MLGSPAGADIPQRTNAQYISAVGGCGGFAATIESPDRMNEKEKVALESIAASAGLTAAKAIIGLLTGSLAVLSDAGHSLLDLSATVLTYFAVRISGKPADAEHQYGHGKVESVSALAETALLFLLTSVVLWESLERLVGAQAHAVAATPAAFAVMAATMVISTTPIRQVETFLVGFILGTCFLLLRYY